jgi:hypothetical protein
LIGAEEPPTDLFLNNLSSCREFILSRFPKATDVETSLAFTDLLFDTLADSKDSKKSIDCELSTVFTQEPSVHTFDLIENLAYWGYYRGRNDGVYGPLTANAVMELQADLADSNFYRKRVDGLYGRYTREAFCNYLRSFGT